MPVRKNYIKVPIAILLGMAAAALFFAGCSQTVVQKNGRLQVIGNQLCNERGEAVQLKGMILMDVAWFGDYANPACFAWLRDDWGCTVIRAALYTQDSFGQPRALTQKKDMIKAVDAAVAAGLYIIIDWHNLADGNPMKYKSEALTFFREMAELYKDTPNVLYEICSEPNGDDITWSGIVKPYAQEVITAIREIDPNNVILVGTPTWSQRVDIAADDPLSFDNIMYTCHFYAGSHFSGLRDKVEYALDKGAAVFISEWGTTDSTGNGILYPEETLEWINFMDEYNLSWTNWSITTRKESSAALKHTALSEGSWADGDLTESGLLVRALIREQDSAIILFADGFETENFIAGGWYNENTGLDRDDVFHGYTAALLNSQSSLAKEFSTVGFRNVRVQLAYKTQNLSGDDSVNIEWYDGDNWQPVKNLGSSENWTKHTVLLPEQADDNYYIQFRISSVFSSSNAIASLDDIALIMDRIE
jgi:endoglucanase